MYKIIDKILPHFSLKIETRKQRWDCRQKSFLKNTQFIQNIWRWGGIHEAFKILWNE